MTSMNNITATLFKMGMSQKMLAEHLNVKKEYVSMYNTGDSKLPRYAWQKIYDYLAQNKE